MVKHLSVLERSYKALSENDIWDIEYRNIKETAKSTKEKRVEGWHLANGSAWKPVIHNSIL